MNVSKHRLWQPFNIDAIGPQCCVRHCRPLNTFPAFLNLFRSYLPDGNCLVSVCNYVTELTNVTWVVKGSILGPSLFYLYMLPLGLIMRNNNIAYRCYADYTQIHIAPSPADYLLIDLLCQCIKQLKDWMWWKTTPWDQQIWTHYTSSQIPEIPLGISEDWFQNTSAHL